MNCEDFENNVNDLARERMMDAAVRAEAFVHRDECAACAQRLAEESALSFRLGLLAAAVAAGEVPVMGEKVLAALRESQAPQVVEKRSVHPRFRAWAVVATASAAVAALVLIAIAVGFMRAGSPAPTANSPSHPGTQNDPGQKDIQTVVGVQLIDKPAQKLETGLGNRRNKISFKRAAVAANRKDAEPSVTVSYSPEVSTDFYPVGYGSAPNLGDGEQQLVRVELPRSALVAFGVPMNVNRYNERVKADVLFGADGMAHAIRFVQ